MVIGLLRTGLIPGGQDIGQNHAMDMFGYLGIGKTIDVVLIGYGVIGQEDNTDPRLLLNRYSKACIFFCAQSCSQKLRLYESFIFYRV
jgi:aspartate/tyrosine/aromatic aminotransferase